MHLSFDKRDLQVDCKVGGLVNCGFHMFLVLGLFSTGVVFCFFVFATRLPARKDGSGTFRGVSRAMPNALQMLLCCQLFNIRQDLHSKKSFSRGI